ACVCPGHGEHRPRPSAAQCFFFQAEDGIRDFHVTGVQTCALPISSPTCSRTNQHFSQASTSREASSARRSRADSSAPSDSQASRSEERRVGKESRARCTASHYNNKEQ